MTRRIPRKRFSVASDKDQDAVAARLESSRARVKETPISEVAPEQSRVPEPAKASEPTKSQTTVHKRKHISIRVSVSTTFDQEVVAWCDLHQLDPSYLRKSLIAKARPVLRSMLATKENRRIIEPTKVWLALPSNRRVLWQRTTISISDDELKQIYAICGDVFGALSEMRVCSAVFGAVLEARGIPCSSEVTRD